ncbi:MAG: bifunctional demethylmenaquinone methyltransferase/2-methoxy-6-polyprenyl-1,4-benzoquinol methylase UbiE [bacterium]
MEDHQLRTRKSYEHSYVRSLFDTIAHRYDFLNHFLSSGLDILWRRKAISLLLKKRPKTILDVATGTGDFALAAVRLNPQKIIGIDPSSKMIEIGRVKIRKKNLVSLISFLTGQAEQLPFPDASFDAALVAFGVRNFSSLTQGLSEMARILKPDGTAIIIEFSHPRNRFISKAYTLYSRWWLPFAGGLISGNRDAYRYLPETVAEFPDGERFAEIVRSSGFIRIAIHPLTFGIVTIYEATKAKEICSH